MSIIQRVPWTAQPQAPTEIARRFANGLIVAVSPRFRGNAIGTKAASAVPAVVPEIDSLAYQTSASVITIPAASIPAGSDVTALFVIRNYSGAGTNPGLWRSGNYFFIVQGSNSRPWIRWSGDILLPSTGFQFAAGGNYNCIYQVASGGVCSFWVNGIQQFTGAGAGATPAISVTNIGYQNDPSQKVGELAETYFWTRYLSDEDCAALTSNPWQIFVPQTRRIWVPSGGVGPVTHTTTGALTGQGSAVAGTALHPHTTTGALTGQGSAVAGTALHPHTTTGALIGQDSAVAGTATHTAPGVHATSGVLTGQGSAVAGTALHPHTTTGALTGQGSTVAGAAVHPHLSSGALVGQGSAVAGAAARNSAAVTHPTSGILVGQGSAVVGAAARLNVKSTTGILVGQGSAVAGAATHISVHAASGALVGQGASVVGSSLHKIVHSSNGIVVGPGAIVVGFGAGPPVATTLPPVTFVTSHYHEVTVQQKFSETMVRSS